MGKELTDILIGRVKCLLVLKSQNGIFVAVDSDNRLIVSTDGDSWEEVKIHDAQLRTISQARFNVK